MSGWRGRALRAGTLILLPIGGVRSAEAQVNPWAPQACPDDRVKLESERGDRSETAIRVRVQGVLEATVTVNLTLVNGISSREVPHTVEVVEGSGQEVLRVRPQNRMKHFFFSSFLRWKPGRRGGSHDDRYVYELPYDPEVAYFVVQGRNGPLSHGPGTGSENAIDFGLPAGAVVRAARPGQVVALRDDSEVGGPEPRLQNCANYVVVRHSDGTYASYTHFQPRSAAVKLGQWVVAGTALGRSGNTGFSTGPHLHFDVFRNVDGTTRETFPVRFSTSDGVLDQLEAGRAYRAPVPASPPAGAAIRK